MNALFILRGVSGSGKSTTVRRLIARAESVERTMDPWRSGWVLYYALDFGGEKLAVIGDYDVASTSGTETAYKDYGRAHVLVCGAARAC